MAPAPGAGRPPIARASRSEKYDRPAPRQGRGAGRQPNNKRRKGMTTLFLRLRFIVGALALLGLLVLTGPVSAQQSTSVNPTASSVKEDQLLQQLRRIDGRGTIPDGKSYVVEQPAGQEFRYFHEVTLHWLGGIAILGMVAL